MNRRAIAARCISVALVAAIAGVQWLLTSPEMITYGEFRLLTLVAAVALIVTLCSGWVLADHADGDTYTDREEQRPIRPPWA